MALPVEQIMSQLQRGDCEDIEEEDDIAEGPELEEELGITTEAANNLGGTEM